MTKIISIIISIIIWVVASNSLYTQEKAPKASYSAINGIEASAPEILSYQEVSTEQDYFSLVENGEFLKADASYQMDSFWVGISSEYGIFAMRTSKGAVLLLSGKDFILTPTEVWYSSSNGVKHFNYADSYLMHLDEGTLLNPDDINLDELLNR